MKQVTVCYLLLVVLVGLAGCGGAAKPTAAPRPPHLPRALARQWSNQATQIASALAAGDGCTAQRLAGSLQTQFIAAVNAHRVPQRFSETLGSAIDGLQSRIACAPAPPSSPAKHGHGHHGKKGGGD